MIKAIFSGIILGLLLSQAGVGWTVLLRDRFKIQPRRWVAALLSAIFSCLLVGASWLVESTSVPGVTLADYWPLLAIMVAVSAVTAFFSLSVNHSGKSDGGKPPSS